LRNDVSRLRAQGIQPTPQRLAVADYVLATTAHPSAEEVWRRVRRNCPTVSRATVYNTLKLFAEKGLIRTLCMREGALLFDGRVEPHHHVVDEASGQVYDVEWDAIAVKGPTALRDFAVSDYQVVMHGRKRN
jgi:Fur family transcriptional regulator, iron response regulator